MMKHVHIRLVPAETDHIVIISMSKLTIIPETDLCVRICQHINNERIDITNIMCYNQLTVCNDMIYIIWIISYIHHRIIDIE